MIYNQKKKFFLINFKVLYIFSLFCFEQIFSHQQHYKRQKKHIINQNEVPINVEWLTDEQLSELGSLDNDSQIAKIRHFYDLLISSEERKVAAKKIVTQCYNWLPEVTSDFEREELKNLREKNHSISKEKIYFYILRLSKERQGQLFKFWEFCERVMNDIYFKSSLLQQENKENIKNIKDSSTINKINMDYKRNKRQIKSVESEHHMHHMHHNFVHDLEHCFKTHLSWLTDNEKKQIQDLKTQGKNITQIQNKIFEFYEKTTGEKKQKAKKLLQNGCREILFSLIGVEKAKEVNKIKKEGKSNKEISIYVEKLIEKLTDEKKKTDVKNYAFYCKKLFDVETKKKRHLFKNYLENRQKRNSHDHSYQHNLEDYFKTHLSWLTDSQKTELKNLKKEGKSRADLQKKIQNYYEQTQGEIKNKATQNLRDGCVELIKVVFGNEKYLETKKMKENGLSIQEISNVIKNSVNTISDPKKKMILQEYAPYCKKLFGVNKKKRHIFGFDKINEIQKQIEFKKLYLHIDNLFTNENTLQENAKKLKNVCQKNLISTLSLNNLLQLKQMKENNLNDEKILSVIKNFFLNEKNFEIKQLLKKFFFYCKNQYINILTNKELEQQHYDRTSKDFYVKNASNEQIIEIKDFWSKILNLKKACIYYNNLYNNQNYSIKKPYNAHEYNQMFEREILTKHNYCLKLYETEKKNFFKKLENYSKIKKN